VSEKCQKSLSGGNGSALRAVTTTTTTNKHTKILSIKKIVKGKTVKMFD